MLAGLGAAWLPQSQVLPEPCSKEADKAPPAGEVISGDSQPGASRPCIPALCQGSSRMARPTALSHCSPCFMGPMQNNPVGTHPAPSPPVVGSPTRPGALPTRDPCSYCRVTARLCVTLCRLWCLWRRARGANLLLPVGVTCFSAPLIPLPHTGVPRSPRAKLVLFSSSPSFLPICHRAEASLPLNSTQTTTN